MAGEKPQCGNADKSEVEYDLPLHVVGLFLILASSLLGAGFPVVAKRFKSLKIPPSIFFACKHFGTGVLIATAFVHLLPTAFGNLMNPCLPDLFTDKYPPMPGVIMMGSMFILFVIEMYLNAKTGGHSHGGPTGEGLTEPSHHQHHHVRPETADAEKKNDTTVIVGGITEDESGYSSPTTTEYRTGDSSSALDVAAPRSSKKNAATEVRYFDEAGVEVDPQVYRKMSANITLLEGGILFHSVFVGMTLSITVDGFVILLIAFLFHQAFEGLGLGSRIAAVPYPQGSVRPWLLVVAFGVTAPLGQAIGLGARNTYDPDSAFGLIIVGVFNAISSGLLIYAALVDLLAQDFLSEEAERLMSVKKKATAFAFVLLGAAAMAFVGAFA
ncbi:Fe(2+) transport protein 3 [Cordyceps fumosorosea ARSEF 2679]|uniref:Fe(2+) transport protein 3 n=1 Tax=Cordyceps fumosorosea (strain ARSEF 2679) TaxID=1081104 RepID=A0A167V2Z3_CORFA|nr:Fe(2+) transport protein 3 [Cordyceps fumosorosea ARSEF 2679]OAA62178.1 Fe(2+) transport protein 3 [Cordyceps fumosorosea ARSEF 2679]